MASAMIESLEPRRLLSGGVFTPGPSVPVAGAQALSQQDVQTILAQAISQGQATQAAVVVDREGIVLGTLVGSGAQSAAAMTQIILGLAAARARTAALFQSNHEAFTTRTARFIIQNHFPPGVGNAAGGPLYGVEFSDLIGSDILLPGQTPAVSGDPGGIPLYINGVAVGAIGVAGDFHDVAATPQLLPLTQLPDYNANPKGRVYQGAEEADKDEAVALAGAQGFMAPRSIRANNIFIGGFALPFTAEPPAHGKPEQSFSQLISGGIATEFSATGVVVAPGTTQTQAGEEEMTNATFAGVPGLVRDRANVQMSNTPGVPDFGAGGVPLPHTEPQDTDGIIGSSDPNGLTLSDVMSIITDAVSQAVQTRAGIRKPNGIHARVHVAVVDTSGNVLGVFRMEDGTNFSYDVAVQKARTAAFFSDDQHAFSTRAIGFMSQLDFPPGIKNGLPGPLFELQNDLDESSTPSNPFGEVTLQSQPAQEAYSRLADGITIFPGGLPLYKNGQLVGAVGVSGDGVDQDDLIAYAGTKGFQPPPQIRSDKLVAADAANFILSRLANIEQTTPLAVDPTIQANKSLLRGLQEIRLPYTKFPRNPLVGH